MSNQPFQASPHYLANAIPQELEFEPFPAPAPKTISGGVHKGGGFDWGGVLGKVATIARALGSMGSGKNSGGGVSNAVPPLSLSQYMTHGKMINEATPIEVRQLKIDAPDPLARHWLDKWEKKKQDSIETPEKLAKIQANVVRLTDQMAQRNGRPSYEVFKDAYGDEQNAKPSRMGRERYERDRSQSNGFITEDEALYDGYKNATQNSYERQQLREQDSREAHLKTQQAETLNAQANYYEEKTKALLRQQAEENSQAAQQNDKAQPTGRQNPVQAGIDASAYLGQMFFDPNNPSQSLYDQAGNARLSEQQYRQLMHNADLLKAHAENDLERQRIEAMRATGKALFSQNWMRDARDNDDGTASYRGLTVHKDKLQALVAADVEHFTKTEQHLGRDPNWQEHVAIHTSGFVKGLAHGASAGGGDKAARGEEAAYNTGSFIAATVINGGAAILPPPLAVAVWASYGAAGETHRQADRGSPFQPGAIAASSALNAATGIIPVKAPLSTLGKVSLGAGTGYTAEIANRAVQQYGDTGQLDASKLDYTPGLGTAFGAVAGGLGGRSSDSHFDNLAGGIAKGNLQNPVKLGAKGLIQTTGKNLETLQTLKNIGLNTAQIRSYKSFVKSEETANIYSYPNGGKAFETVKIGDAPNSFTIWEKHINLDGTSFLLGHKTFANGKPVHWHEKRPENREINFKNVSTKEFSQRLQQIVEFYNP